VLLQCLIWVLCVDPRCGDVILWLSFPSLPSGRWVFGTWRSEKTVTPALRFTSYVIDSTLKLCFGWSNLPLVRRRQRTHTTATEDHGHEHLFFYVWNRLWFVYQITPIVINSNSSLIIHPVQHVFVPSSSSPKSIATSLPYTHTHTHTHTHTTNHFDIKAEISFHIQHWRPRILNIQGPLLPVCMCVCVCVCACWFGFLSLGKPDAYTHNRWRSWPSTL